MMTISIVADHRLCSILAYSCFSVLCLSACIYRYLCACVHLFSANENVAGCTMLDISCVATMFCFCYFVLLFALPVSTLVIGCSFSFPLCFCKLNVLIN